MSFSLVVPSVAESSITGFIMAAKKSIYKQEWQITISTSGASITKNGKAVEKDDALKQKGFLTFWNEFISFYNSTTQVN